jgi:hypothetical protein
LNFRFLIVDAHEPAYLFRGERAHPIKPGTGRIGPDGQRAARDERLWQVSTDNPTAVVRNRRTIRARWNENRKDAKNSKCVFSRTDPLLDG